MDQACARLSQLHDCAPEQVGQHQANEIQVLREFDDETRQEPVARTGHHLIRDPCGPREQHERRHPKIVMYSHLLENVAVQTHEGKIQEDGQNGVGHVIEIEVMGRSVAVASENKIAANVKKKNCQQVKAEGEVLPNRAGADDARHRGGVQQDTY